MGGARRKTEFFRLESLLVLFGELGMNKGVKAEFKMIKNYLTKDALE
jgi:hypothetical protein